MKIQEVKAPQQWLKLINGDYSVLFHTLETTAITVPLVSGQVVTFGTKTGIVAKDEAIGATQIRCLVRGNPSTVIESQMIGMTAEQKTILEAHDIVFA